MTLTNCSFGKTRNSCVVYVTRNIKVKISSSCTQVLITGRVDAFIGIVSTLASSLSTLPSSVSYSSSSTSSSSSSRPNS